MSNFEEMVLKMRKAQIEYNARPTLANLEAVEDLEIEVDEYLEFLVNCPNIYSFSEVKKYLRTRT